MERTAGDTLMLVLRRIGIVIDYYPTGIDMEYEINPLLYSRAHVLLRQPISQISA